MENRTYIAIDLKSFYASVECVERGLDPLNTNLVVADASRTEKTICLAVSPSLKAYGIPGRARLFEVIQKVSAANNIRKLKAPNKVFCGSSDDSLELQKKTSLKIDYIIAPPRMARYMEYSTKIYNIYLKYIAPEDIHIYSIDEVFIDATAYLRTYGMTAKKLAEKMIRDVLEADAINVVVKESRAVSESLAVLDPPNDGLVPGMTVDVEIIVAEAPDAIQVPADAVVSRGGETLVYKLDGSRVRATPVKIGLASVTATEVLEGLAPGDVVVVVGAQGLVDGARVDVRRADARAP